MRFRSSQTASRCKASPACRPWTLAASSAAQPARRFAQFVGRAKERTPSCSDQRVAVSSSEALNLVASGVPKAQFGRLLARSRAARCGQMPRLLASSLVGVALFCSRSGQRPTQRFPCLKRPCPAARQSTTGSAETARKNAKTFVGWHPRVARCTGIQTVRHSDSQTFRQPDTSDTQTFRQSDGHL